MTKLPTVLGDWRIDVNEDSDYAAEILSDPSKYSDYLPLATEVAEALEDGNLVAANVDLEVAVVGEWEFLGSISTIIKPDLLKVYSSLDEITDEHLKELGQSLIDDHEERLTTGPLSQLTDLARKVQLQEGTGQVGGWDDEGTTMKLVELLKQARVIR